jgi:hypothetical protein
MPEFQAPASQPPARHGPDARDAKNLTSSVCQTDHTQEIPGISRVWSARRTTRQRFSPSDESGPHVRETPEPRRGPGSTSRSTASATVRGPSTSARESHPTRTRSHPTTSAANRR